MPSDLDFDGPVGGDLDRATAGRQGLTPESLSQYLTAQSWELLRFEESVLETWRAPGGLNAFRGAVLIPLSTEFDDYELRMTQAVREIGSAYGISLSELTERVTSLHSDLLFIRLDQFTSDGTIPFKQANELFSNIETLFKSAATTVLSPSHSHVGRRPQSVADFLQEDLRLGHTKHGSFIVTVAARHEDNTPPEVRPAELDQFQATSRHPAAPPDELAALVEPLARRVMATLSRALSATKESLVGELPSLVPNAIEAGVSLELLESIQSIGLSDGLAHLDLTFNWAASIPEPDGVTNRISFARDEIESMERLEEPLRRRMIPHEVTLMGQVTDLSRPEIQNSDSGLGGEIILAAPYDGRTRNVVVPLSGADYDWAIVAHRNYWPFTVTGEIHKTNRWRLTGNIRSDLEFLKRMQESQVATESTNSERAQT